MRFESPVLEDVVPAEYRADLVQLLVASSAPVLAIVIEAQLERKPRKRYTWPAYVAALRARFGCPAVLLVVAPRPSIARWAATPIELGHPGWVLRPLVVGPVPLPRSWIRHARSRRLSWPCYPRSPTVEGNAAPTS